MPFYNSRFGTLHYTLSPRSGQKQAAVQRPPLLLVAGAGADVWHWPPQLRHLPGALVYALDLPGHGRSGGQGATDVGVYAAALHEFVMGVGLVDFVLAGHSMGGAIALAYALAHPLGLEGTVLIGTGARMPVAPALLDGILGDFERISAQIVHLSYGSGADESLKSLALEHLRANDPQLLWQDFTACSQFDVTGELAALGTPALIICGIEDRMISPKASEFLHANLPDSRFRLVERAGHMVQLEQPDAVAGWVAAFLDELSGQIESFSITE